MQGQTTLLPPFFPKCQETCKHFDSHPEWKPDRFAWPPDKRRCTYCNHEYGTSGKQFKFENITEYTSDMYCIYYEV